MCLAQKWTYEFCVIEVLNLQIKDNHIPHMLQVDEPLILYSVKMKKPK